MLAVRGFQRIQRRAAHDFHQVGWHTNRHLTSTQHHHLSYRSCQRHNQAESAATARFGMGFDATTQGIHLGAHHVHANTATGYARHLGYGTKARLKDQTAGLFHIQSLVDWPQAQ